MSPIPFKVEYKCNKCGFTTDDIAVFDAHKCGE